MLGALSVLVFWAFGLGIVLGIGAIAAGVFARSVNDHRSG